MTTSRGGPTATLLSNGEVLLAGGCVDARCTYVALASAELYKPATGTFSATGSMNATRFDGQTATLLPNGQVLVAGGYGTNYVVPVPERRSLCRIHPRPGPGHWAAASPFAHRTVWHSLSQWR